MNRQTYRIIFNKARGCLMAVAETAASQGKGAHGERASKVARPKTSAEQRCQKQTLRLKALVSSIIILLVSMPMPMQAQTTSVAMNTRIVADPNAPKTQQATVLTTSNGVVQVNIQTPSSAGVSRNTFNQFDVGAQGAILNNSRTNVQSQLGGWVQGNPWLATGSARVILNEVNSSNPSYLQGYVEVAGPKAEVIIANPSGIAVNGGGFINASGVTLSTGTPMMNNGALERYRVTGGNVSIDGQGLDTRTADYTAILTRAAQVNAGIWANQLQVVTGANDITASSVGSQSALQTAPLAGTGSAPAYALDVAQLGGMYAGKITLIGTEAGLGVRNAGQLLASSGPLTLTHEGWLANSGGVQASAQLQITAASGVDNKAVIYAGDALSITSSGPQSHSGITAALGQVQIQAQGPQGQIQSTREGLIASGMQPNGTLVGGQDLKIIASDRLQLAGQTVATQNLNLRGTGVDISQGQISAIQAQVIASSEDLAATQSRVNIAQALQLSTPKTLRTDGANIQAQQLQLQAHDLSNVHGQLTQQGSSDLNINLEGQFDNIGGALQSNGMHLNIQAQQINNNSGQLLHAGTGQLSIQSDTLTNTRESANTVIGQGQISTNGQLDIQSQEVSNAGAIYAAGNSHVNTTRLTNSGSLYTSAAQIITATDTVYNSGTLAAQGHTSIQAGQINSTTTSVLSAGLKANGTLADTGDLQVNTTQNLIARGQNIAAGSVKLQGQSIDLQSSQSTTQHGNIELVADLQGAGGDIKTVQAKILSAADLDIRGQGLNNTQGTLQAAKNLRLNVKDLDNTQGQIHANQNLTLQIQNGLTNTGTISTNQDLNIALASLSNSGVLYAGASQSLTVANAVSTSGTIAAGKDLSITAGSFSGTGSNVLAAVSCPSVRNSFFAESQPLFFQRSASWGWFMMGSRYFFVLRCARFSTKADTHAGMVPARCGQSCWRWF